MTKSFPSIYKYQEIAANNLRTGSILCGGVGSGKTRTAIMYYYRKEASKKLYVITTAAKRDTLDWEREYNHFKLNFKMTVDSWNNIKKYIDVKESFFIFDEQRVIGSGSWVKSFLKIVKQNNWILLSATPGDTWMDYIPVFVANGFYKNRTEFIRRHVVYNSFVKFPRVDHYVEEGRLVRLKEKILVTMAYERPTIRISKTINVGYDKEIWNLVSIKRWNPYKNKPIKDISELCFVMRKVVNSDSTRFINLLRLIQKHNKIIVFYNFNYELDILRQIKNDPDIVFAEYNGHKHESLPAGPTWVYAVQYTSGSEGWNCIETNTIVFYSQNYSYRTMLQASGRIDRLNTSFAKLYYYTLKSDSLIDVSINKALKKKEDFNEETFKLALKTYAIMEGE